MVIISVFQTDDRGPIPLTRSNKSITIWWCFYFLGKIKSIAIKLRCSLKKILAFFYSGSFCLVKAETELRTRRSAKKTYGKFSPIQMYVFGLYGSPSINCISNLLKVLVYQKRTFD